MKIIGILRGAFCNTGGCRHEPVSVAWVCDCVSLKSEALQLAPRDPTNLQGIKTANCPKCPRLAKHHSGCTSNTYSFPAGSVTFISVFLQKRFSIVTVQSTHSSFKHHYSNLTLNTVTKLDCISTCFRLLIPWTMLSVLWRRRANLPKHN